MPLFIFWSFDPEIVHLPMLAPRWYGLLFAIAFYSGYVILRKVWLKEKLTEKSLDTLSWYIILATLVGARLGHVFFYGPWWDEFDAAGNLLVEGYFSHPISILNIREGGLASHGATIGVLIGLYLYRRSTKLKKSYLWLVDRVVIVVAIGAALVRIGNFTNSEIIGIPSDAPTAVIFAQTATSRLDANLVEEGRGLYDYNFTATDKKVIIDSNVYIEYLLNLSYSGSEDEFHEFVLYRLTGILNTNNPTYRHTSFNGFQEYEISGDNNLKTAQVKVLMLPRHPAQLYESFGYLLLFLLLYALYRKYGTEIQEGLLFGVFLFSLFTTRFFVEFVKENQVSFEDDLALNMGQNLSIPFALIGIGFIIYSFKKKTKAP